MSTAGPVRSNTHSKTLATWAAVLGGFFGLHRFYLRGMADPWGWLHAAAAFLGMMGVQRIRSLGVDDPHAATIKDREVRMARRRIVQSSHNYR